MVNHPVIIVKKKMPAIINYKTCRDSDTEHAYPEFFETIRTHKAHQLYGQWAAALGFRRGDFQPPQDMKPYYKEKKKLMALLKPLTTTGGIQLCAQPGAVIDRVLWADWLIRPGQNPDE